MNETGGKRGLALFTALFLFLFYVAIIMYVFFGVIHIEVLQNFVCGLVFEIIGFVILFSVIICNLIGKTVKLGYLIPSIICTVIYTILLNLINIIGILYLSSAFFILIHTILLFLSLLIVMPMLIMGKR